MRPPLQHTLFIFSSLLFAVHQLLQQVLKIPIPLADAYLDNLLAMPIILPLLEWEQVYLFRQRAGYQLTLLAAIIATIYVSVISELVFPALSKRFIFDPWDFVFFFMGAAFHLLVTVTRCKRSGSYVGG